MAVLSVVAAAMTNGMDNEALSRVDAIRINLGFSNNILINLLGLGNFPQKN